MFHSDDFYMILPSNASPDSHPHNYASDYIVSWENPIYLDRDYNWKVAMTEISYIYKPTSLSSRYGIQMSKWCKSIDQGKIVIGIKSGKIISSLENLKTLYQETEISMQYDFKAYLTNDDKFRIECAVPFQLDFSQCHDPDWAIDMLGLYGEKVLDCVSRDSHYEIIGDNIREKIDTLEEGKDWTRLFDHVMIRFFTYKFKTFTKSFPENRSFPGMTDMVDYLNQDLFNDTFKYVQYNSSSNRIEIALQDLIESVELLNGLHYVLGYDDPKIHRSYSMESFIPHQARDDFMWHATNPPQLHRGITNMFVYASICKPVYVGHTYVPLLKNVFIDSSNDSNEKGAARNYVVVNPMYVPVSRSVFSSIEINIRDDIGHIVPFPRGSITSLTVHFMKA